MKWIKAQQPVSYCKEWGEEENSSARKGSSVGKYQGLWFSKCIRVQLWKVMHCQTQMLEIFLIQVKKQQAWGESEQESEEQA
jgi:hypothetical protein